jgi:hypothetical protein
VRILIYSFFFIAMPLSSLGQEFQKQDFSIKVGVEEVRIDATVLDRKGRQITDLTAGDLFAIPVQ